MNELDKQRFEEAKTEIHNQAVRECIGALNRKEEGFTDYDQDSFSTAIETLQALIKE